MIADQVVLILLLYDSEPIVINEQSGSFLYQYKKQHYLLFSDKKGIQVVV